MQYRVRWFSRMREVGSTPFNTKAAAEAHAREHFPAKQNQGIDRVEVCDENGQVVFQRPRTVSRA